MIPFWTLHPVTSCIAPQVLVEILTDLRLGEFEVKLNHRGLLDAMLEIAGEV